MHFYLLVASLLVHFCNGAPQAAPVHVKLRIVLLDKDLNQKPVPFFVVRLQKEGASDPPAELKTDLDGKAEKEFPPGRYTLSSAKPIDFQGQRYSWNFQLQITDGEQHLDLTNDNAKTEALPPTVSAVSSGAADGQLTTLFNKLKDSIVAVHSDFGTGSGFLVDSSGLVVTNNHVVNSSLYLDVQFDDKRKVPARLVTADPDKDVAVIRFDPSAFPEGIVAPLLPNTAASHLAVGQRVFTIGNPLGRDKALTTGIISKIEKDSLNSDLNINPGNSGGPLFTLDGQVAGITTSLLRTLASIVPVEFVRPQVDQAKKDIANEAPPAPVLLPVAPTDFFPADALRNVLKEEKLDTKPYFFDAGEFQVGFFTPPLTYYLRHEEEMAAARKAAKRTGGDAATPKPPASALEDAQDYRPILVVRVRPKYNAVFKVRFKNGFVRMKLLCGGKEVTPILPGREEFDLYDQRERKTDTTHQGAYEYLPSSVSPTCGAVVLEIYSEKSPDTPEIRTVDPSTIQRVWADFAPSRVVEPSPAPAPAKP
jgi:S1-C subfamily serine protease